MCIRDRIYVLADLYEIPHRIFEFNTVVHPNTRREGLGPANIVKITDCLLYTSNYGAYLLAALDLVKDQFTEDELKTLTEGSEQIRDLEDQIQPLQEQYAALQPAGDGEDGGMNDAVPTFPTSVSYTHLGP